MITSKVFIPVSRDGVVVFNHRVTMVSYLECMKVLDMVHLLAELLGL